ncbi:hypothetical protein [Jiulongibacter sp. NS-SX5]|uniref:hypothetical protein n=1 Tax=Jiulongibacter sp. NS-SX5 TaxID=3463854 RepID=UPI0040590BBD
MKQLFYLFLSSIFLFSCSYSEPEEKSPVFKPSRDAQFSTFQIDSVKAVIVDCDLGRLKISIHQYPNPKIEIHNTYQKYVRLEPKGDTLKIVTLNTPKKSENPDLKKEINLYIPNLEYLNTNISQVTFRTFDAKNLKVVNQSSALRFYDSRIENLDLTNLGRSNIQLDENNIFNTIYFRNNSKSQLTSAAEILSELSVEAEDLERINFKSFRGQFNWIK